MDPRTGIPVYDSYGGATVADYVGFFEASGGWTPSASTFRMSAHASTPTSGPCGGEPCRRHPGPVPRLLSWIARTPSAARHADRSCRRGFESGVGQLGIALQHGMTVGELAKYFNAVHLPAAGLKSIQDLQVVEVQGCAAT